MHKNFNNRLTKHIFIVIKIAFHINLAVTMLVFVFSPIFFLLYFTQVRDGINKIFIYRIWSYSSFLIYFGKIYETVLMKNRLAKQGQFPYLVSLKQKADDDDIHFCSGSILNIRWIVTAGHCKVSISPKRYYAVSGVRTLDKGGNSYGIKRYALHPEYKVEIKSYDLALLLSNTPFIFDEFTQPISLINFKLESGTKVMVSGWRRLEVG